MKSKLALFMLVIACNVHSADLDLLKWRIEGAAAMITTKMGIPGNEKFLISTLVIDPRLQSECRESFISILSMKEPKLGELKNRDFSDAKKRGGKINIFINGAEYQYESAKTLRVIYENGVEFGTIVPIDLIERIKNNQGRLELRLADTPIFILSSSPESSEVISQAQRNCLTKLKINQ